jgi:hypothetical protein
VALEQCPHNILKLRKMNTPNDNLTKYEFVSEAEDDPVVMKDGEVVNTPPVPEPIDPENAPPPPEPIDPENAPPPPEPV